MQLGLCQTCKAGQAAHAPQHHWKSWAHSLAATQAACLWRHLIQAAKRHPGKTLMRSAAVRVGHGAKRSTCRCTSMLSVLARLCPAKHALCPCELWHSCWKAIARPPMYHRNDNLHMQHAPCIHESALWPQEPAAAPAPGPPRLACAAGCHGRGRCDHDSGWCRCTAGWTGRACEVRQARACNGPAADDEPWDNMSGFCGGDQCDDNIGHCAPLGMHLQAAVTAGCARLCARSRAAAPVPQQVFTP